MKEYKAELAYVNRKKLESATSKLAEGTPFFVLTWKIYEEQTYGQWVGVNVDKFLDTVYFLGSEVVYDGKTRSCMARENLKRDIGYEDGGSLESFTPFKGTKRILKTEMINNCERVKFVDDPERVPSMGKFDQFTDSEDAFKDIFAA